MIIFDLIEVFLLMSVFCVPFLVSGVDTSKLMTEPLNNKTVEEFKSSPLKEDTGSTRNLEASNKGDKKDSNTADRDNERNDNGDSEHGNDGDNERSDYGDNKQNDDEDNCLLYTSPSPRDS